MTKLAITIETNAADVARKNHWRAQRMRDALKGAQDANAALLLKAAQEMSNLDDHSLSDLARMGHPYARRNPRPPHPPQLIHTQRGNFLRRWVVQKHRNGDEFSITLDNTARTRNGRQLLPLLQKGTRKMIARPILDYLRTGSSVEREMQLNNRRAYRSAIGLHGAAATSRARSYLAGLG